MTIEDLVPAPADRTFFAACPRGVSELLAGELRELELDVQREHPAGVSFRGPLRSAYVACLQSRTASRVLMTLAEVNAADPDMMYQALRHIAWEEHVRPEGTFSIDIVGESPAWLRNTQFAALKAKDAIVDRMRELNGVRPSVDRATPDVRINLRFARDRVTVGIDLSGEPLHRRGYRQSGVEAPLKENLAAALLLRCGWATLAKDGAAFFDPMCGSGTLVIEAALIAASIAPGLLRRRFGFESWLQHDAELWNELRSTATAARNFDALPPGRIAGSDRDQTAVRSAIANANSAGLGNHLVFDRRDVAQLTPTRHAHGLALVNPPYGVRIGDVTELESLYGLLGSKLHECFPGWDAGMIISDPVLGRALGLRAHRQHTFFNGAIECRLLRFHLDETAVEPDRAVVRAARIEAARLRPGSAMFGNRLRKNAARLAEWARRNDVACYRVYDADMPEYAFAIDVYSNAERWVCVQEYAAPATVAEDAVRARRDEALAAIPEVMGVPAERMMLRVRRRQRGGEQYEKIDAEQQFHEVREGRYRFLVNFTDYLDTGLFLDHRLTRERIGQLAQGKRFLNLFAYTGSATVHAVGGGAVSSTTVDMSHTYLDWARRNLVLNGMASPAHEFIQADCLTWLDEEAQQFRVRQYDLIFIDPPTHSRSKRMQQEFDVQRDHPWLLQTAGRLLAPGGVIVFSNNFQRFKLDTATQDAFEVEDITRATIPEDYAQFNKKIHVCYLLRKRQSALRTEAAARPKNFHEHN